VFGTRAGVAAVALALGVWLLTAAGFSSGLLVATDPNDPTLFLNWVAGAMSLLLVMVGLIIPQRQFLATRLFAASTSEEKAALEAAQARLAAETAALEAATREAQAARRDQEAQARALEHRAALLSLSAEVAHAAAAVRDLDELLQTSVSLISQRFGFYHTGLFLLDDAREWAVLSAANSPGGRRMLARGHRLRVGREGIVGYVTGSGQPRIALDVGADAVYFVNPDLPETRSEMAVPLRAREVIIGALDVQSVDTNAFSQEDTHVLQSLADQIGLAIDNTRLLQETQQRLAELQALQISTRQAAGLSGSERTAAFRYDGLDVRPLAEPDQAIALPGALRVPLQFGEQQLGVLELTRAGESWSAEDLELTAAIADRMALALESAQLFEQTRTRAQQLAALSESALELTGPQFNTQQALDQICRGAQRLFGVDGAGIWLPSGEDEIELRVTYSAGQPQPSQKRVKLHASVAGQVYNSGLPVRLEDNSAESQGLAGLAEAPVLAALAVPMTWQGQRLGVLSLTHSTPDRVFSGDDERIALLYAAQAASTLENARLFAETRQRLTELAAINSISTAVTAQRDLNVLLPLVGEKVFDTFGVNDGFIALYDSRTNLIEFPLFVEAGVRQIVSARPLGQGLTSIVIQSRQPLLINQDALRRSAELGALLQGAPAKSWLGVPITAGTDVIGVLCVQDIEREGLFSDADVRLLTTIAANVGVAIQNARLFNQTQQRAAELAVLNDLARAVSQELEPVQVLETVYTHLQRLTPLDAFFVTLFDRGTGLQTTPLIYDAGRRYAEGPRPPAAGGLIERVLQTGQPIVVNRTAAEVAERQLTPERAIGDASRVSASLLYLPLFFGTQVGGVLSVQSYQYDQYSQREVEVLSAVASQLVVALQNARLFEETQRRAEQLATAADVSRTAISVLNPDDLIVQSVELIRERFARSAGVHYAALFLVDETGAWARLRHATGEAGRVLLERQHKLEVGGNSMVGWATANRRARIALDVGAEPVRFANPLLPDTRSEIALPLVVGDAVLGALDVQSTRAGAFAQADVAVLQTMVDQVAIALRNAQLLAATQRTQNFLDSIIENLPSMLFVKDAQDLRFVRWNRAAESLVGFAREEMLGKSDTDVFPPEEAQHFFRKDREVIEARRMIEIAEESIQTRHQGTRWLHTRKIPILDEAGQPQFMVGISEDITERKAADERLRAAEERYRSLVEQLPAIIYAAEVPSGGAMGRTTYISPQVQSLLGYTPEEWLSDPDLWIKLLHPEDREAVLQEVARQNALGAALDLEYRSLTHDGRLIWFHNQSQAFLDANTGQMTTRGIMFDITARKQAEAALKAAQETAQRRAQLLAAAADVARAMTASLDRDELLRTAVNLIRERFGFYHASVFIVEPGSQMAVLRESTGEAGALLKARQHKLAVGSRSLVGSATASRRPVVVQDVTADPNHFKNPLLPDTRAEAVVPLLSGSTVVGALDAQSNRPNAFAAEDVAILVTIADQLAVALQNARLYDQTARQARRERLVVDITSKIRAADDMDTMLRTAVTELRQALGVTRAAVRLELPGGSATGGRPRGTGGLRGGSNGARRSTSAGPNGASNDPGNHGAGGNQA
jgi:PAS domain S-box-containing protein